MVLPVVQGRCYFAAVSMIRGKSRGIRLSATASAKTSVEELSGSPDALGLSFCADGLDEARVAVDVPGASLWWVLGVWELGHSAPVASQPGAAGLGTVPAMRGAAPAMRGTLR